VAKDPHPHGDLDWSSAAVRDRVLAVEVSGTPNADWARGLESVVERLYRPGSGWGEIEISKATLRVAAVTPGCEADLRHFLDSVVLQVNSNFAPREEGDEAGDDSGGSAQDREMTEVFRSFSSEPEQPEDQPA
jgi:hypothetical protein